MAIEWGNYAGLWRLGVKTDNEGDAATVRFYAQNKPEIGGTFEREFYFTGDVSGRVDRQVTVPWGESGTVEVASCKARGSGARTYGLRDVHSGATVSTSLNFQAPGTPHLTTVHHLTSRKWQVSWQAGGGHTRRFLFQFRQWIPVDKTWGAWVSAGTVSGDARNYVFTGVEATAYQFRVKAFNAAGESAYSAPSLWVASTPPAPFNVRAFYNEVRGITVDWDGAKTAPELSYQVQGLQEGYGDDWGGPTQVTWEKGKIVEDLPGYVKTRVKYRVRSIVHNVHDGGYDLTSGWVESAWIEPASKPRVPYPMTPPNGIVLGPGNVKFTWQHNPTDGSLQSAYELQTQVGDEGIRTWPGTAHGGVAVTIGPLNPGRVQWRVRTKGTHPSWSEWSRWTRFQIIEYPVAKIVAPTGTVGRRRVKVEWEYTQAQHARQTGWHVWLKKHGRTVQEVEGDGEQTYAYVEVENDTTYTVEVEVSYGRVKSYKPASAEFSVSYVKPAKPTVRAMFNPEGQFVDVWVENYQNLEGPGRAVQFVYYYQRPGHRGGDSYDYEDPVPWAYVSGDPFPVPDYAPDLDDVMQYAIKAVTADGAETWSNWVYVPTPSKCISITGWCEDAIWMNPDERPCLLYYDPEVSGEVTADRQILQFDGRRFPVPVEGAYRGRSVKLSGTIFEREYLDHLLWVVEQNIKVFHVAYPRGSVTGIIKNVSYNRLKSGAWRVSFEVERTEEPRWGVRV